jgi:hypothetical protein
VTMENLAYGAVFVAILVYLFWTLVRPEQF